MNIIRVKFGKPSKFYVNNKLIDLNTAFGMYKKGANFIVNGKKLNLNENSFGAPKRKKKKKKKKKKRPKRVKKQPESAAYRIPSDLVQKIILMAPPSRTARIMQDNIREQREARIREENAQILESWNDRWNQTMRWSSDSEDWYAPSHSGEPGLYRGEVMELPPSQREIVMDTLRNRPVGYWPEPYTY